MSVWEAIRLHNNSNSSIHLLAMRRRATDYAEGCSDLSNSRLRHSCDRRSVRVSFVNRSSFDYSSLEKVFPLTRT